MTIGETNKKMMIFATKWEKSPLVLGGLKDMLINPHMTSRSDLFGLSHRPGIAVGCGPPDPHHHAPGGRPTENAFHQLRLQWQQRRATSCERREFNSPPLGASTSSKRQKGPIIPSGGTSLQGQGSKFKATPSKLET